MLPGDVLLEFQGSYSRKTTSCFSQLFENFLLTVLERLCVNFSQSQSMGWNSRTEYEFLKLGNHPSLPLPPPWRTRKREALSPTHSQRSKRGMYSSYYGQGRDTSVFNVAHHIFCLPNSLRSAAELSLLWRLLGLSRVVLPIVWYQRPRTRHKYTMYSTCLTQRS